MRRSVAAIVLVLGLAVGVRGDSGAAVETGPLPPVPATCVDPPPCVYVTPDPERFRWPGAVFTYQGRGWRPGVAVDAQHGRFCPPPLTCPGAARVELRADAQGRFVFRLRSG